MPCLTKAATAFAMLTLNPERAEMSLAYCLTNFRVAMLTLTDEWSLDLDFAMVHSS